MPIAFFPRLVAASCLVAIGLTVRAAEPVVTIHSGTLRGMPLGSEGAIFRGIPFAQPPVGALRWREPQPVVPWQGVRDATKAGPPAAQPDIGWNADMAAASNEDCLYLDVWTPRLAHDAKLPVMVWVHGGANVGGAGGFDALYDGGPLTRHGVILVVIEYRLGIFGFLAHPELTAESPHHSSGNYAILDQLAALQWVHDNITAFGGDPGNVTLFGQSAGSADLLAALASPLSRGLVHRAIAESSAPVRANSLSLAEAERRGAEAVGKLSSGHTLSLEQLRKLPTAELLKVRDVGGGFVIDNWVFKEPTTTTWKAGRAAPIPLIIGTNAIEFPFPCNAQTVRSGTGPDADRALALYGLAEGSKPLADDPIYGNLNEQWGGDVIRGPSIIHGEWQANAGRAVWEYQFDRAIPPRTKVEHSGEMPYVFGHFDLKRSNMVGDYTAGDHQLSDTIQRYWTNFAKTGNPNGPGLPDWPKYEAANCRFLEFTQACEEAVHDHQRGPFTALFRDWMNDGAK